MGTLALFPWLDLGDEKKTFGDFDLIPYRREQPAPDADAAHRATLDALLQPFVERGDQPIRRATLLGVQGDLLGDLDEREKAGAFAFAELLAVAGLAARQFFFLPGLGYCNRDDFRLVIREFEHPGGLVAISTRRRDGATTNLVPPKIFRVHKPAHVTSAFRMSVDEELLGSLLTAQHTLDAKDWSAVFEAIILFNSANTDSPYVGVQSEVVFLCAALERIVAGEGSEEKLLRGFRRLFAPQEPVHPSTYPRLSDHQGRFRQPDCISEMWLRDFFRLRGDLAHGSLEPRYPAIWRMADHLLLASFLFPLLLKLRLQQSGQYELQDDDDVLVNVFEHLASEEHCAPRAAEDEGDASWPWTKIIGEAKFKAAIRASMETAREETEEDDPGPE